MKLNTKSRMAIAAILDVAMHSAEKPVALAGVSKRQDISLSYLEQLFRMLRERGFVVSSRGPGGGYRMNKHLAAISVADIIDAVDTKSDASGSCRGTDDCHDSNSSCHAHGLWCRVDQHLQDYLRTVTLESILEEARSDARATAADMPAVSAFAEDMSRRREEMPSPAFV